MALSHQALARFLYSNRSTKGHLRSNTMQEQLKAAALSYLRAALSCVGALYLSGITDPKVLANAFLAGLIGPVLKALAPNEKQLGIGAK